MGTSGTFDFDLDRKTVSIMQACELVHVSRRTIYNWLNRGELQFIRTAGGSVRIYTDSLFRPAGTSSGKGGIRGCTG